MIDKKELRVGNLVFSTSLEIACPVQTIEVSSIALKHNTGKVRCDYVDHKNTSINPIPLTPEWLERCGFVKNTREEWDGPKIELEHSLEWFTIKGYRSDSFMLMGSEWTMGKPFHYLHQLQNLYFALTGEELTIKELP